MKELSEFIPFQIDEEHQTQIELEVSLITSWKDTQVPRRPVGGAAGLLLSSFTGPGVCVCVQLSQAGDLIIEVYLEMKIPDCCITLKVCPTTSPPHPVHAGTGSCDRV